MGARGTLTTLYRTSFTLLLLALYGSTVSILWLSYLRSPPVPCGVFRTIVFSA